MGVLTLFLGIWLTLMIYPACIQGATIVLKNGTELQTPKVWVDNSQIHFVLDGLPAVIAPRDIAKIMDAPSEVSRALASSPLAPTSPRPKRGKTKIQPAAVKPPSSIQPEPDHSAPLASSSLGFQDLTWDMRVTDIPGLEKIDEDPSFGGIIQYHPTDAEMKFGGANLAEVVYGFWEGRFYTLSLLVADKAQFDVLKSEAFARFGPGIQTDDSRQVYIWYGSVTDRMLEYDPAQDLGLLWMRSADLNATVTRAKTISVAESMAR